MMLKLFIEKEKSSLFLLFVYFYFLLIYAGTLIDPSEADFETGIIGFFIWGELLHLSPFSLTSYFKRNHLAKMGKPSYYSLDTNLKMLSIPFNKFFKYNIVYNFLKILPFLILLLIFGRTLDDYIYFSYFLLFVGIFSILSPINTKYIGPILKIRVENIFENKQDMKAKISDHYKSTYPSKKSSEIRFMRVIYIISVGLAYVGVVGIQSNIQTSYLNTFANVTGILGIIMLILTTIYFTTLVLGSNNEI